MRDLISRQDAIDKINARRSVYSGTWGKGLSMAVDTLRGLPSAEPERKKGEWIYGEKSGQDGWYCSECGGFIPWYYDFYGLDNIDFIEDFNTCPFCDSKMMSHTGGNMRQPTQHCTEDYCEIEEEQHG